MTTGGYTTGLKIVFKEYSLVVLVLKGINGALQGLVLGPVVLNIFISDQLERVVLKVANCAKLG